MVHIKANLEGKSKGLNVYIRKKVESMNILKLIPQK